jgi:hypothetical protein
MFNHLTASCWLTSTRFPSLFCILFLGCMNGTESCSINSPVDMATSRSWSRWSVGGWVTNSPRDGFEITSVGRLVRRSAVGWSLYGQTSFLAQRRPLRDLLRYRGLGLLPGRGMLRPDHPRNFHLPLKGSKDSELHSVSLFLWTWSIIQHTKNEVTTFRELALLPSSGGNVCSVGSDRRG